MSDFDFPQISPDLLKTSKKYSSKVKKTKEEQKELQELLAIGLEERSLEKVRSALEGGAAYKGSSKLRDNVRVISFALNHFDQEIMDHIMAQKGATLGFYDVLVKETASSGNTEALLWLLDRPERGPTNNANAFEAAASNRKNHTIAAILKHSRLNDARPLMVNGDYSGSYQDRRVIIYDYLAPVLFQLVLDKKDKNLLNEILKIKNIDCSIKGANQFVNDHQHIASNFFQNGLTHGFKKSLYEDVSWFQDQIQSNQDLRKYWKMFVPLSFYVFRGFGADPATTNHTTAKNLLEIVVSQGSNAVSGVSVTPEGRKALMRVFDQRYFLSNFLRFAPKDVSMFVIENMKEDFKNWVDQDGNNLAHYLLHVSSNKSMAMDIYSIHKDWLSQENTAGKSPIDTLPEKAKSEISNKLLRRTLNDNKTGLIHNRKKKNKRM